MTERTISTAWCILRNGVLHGVKDRGGGRKRERGREQHKEGEKERERKREGERERKRERERGGEQLLVKVNYKPTFSHLLKVNMMS